MEIYRTIIQAIAKAVGIFAPVTAARYLHGHSSLDGMSKRGYVAGKTTGPNQLWRPSGTSGDHEIRRDGALTRWRAQDLERNNPFIKGLVDRYKANVIGDGLWPRPLVRDSNGDLDKKLITTISDYHERWAETAGIDGSSLYDLQAVAAGHEFVDGEAFEITSVIPGKGLKIQILEAGQLDETYDGELSNGNIGVKGVEIDKFGAPVAYHFWEYHPGDMGTSSGLGYGKSTSIPAYRVRHIFRRRRASQHRGICHFASVVQDIFDTMEYKDATMVLCRLAAAWGIFVETPYPEDMFTTEQMTDFSNSIGATKNEYINPGGIHTLMPNQKPHGFKPEQPTAQYKDFQRQGLLGASVGAGDSYENFTNDFSSSSWSSSRQGMVTVRAFYRMASGMFDRQLNIPLYREVLDFGVATGELALPGYQRNRPNFQRVKFSRPRMEWVDPSAEAKAAETEIQLGINSRTQIIEDRGGDRDEVFDLLAEEKAMMIERGIFQQDPSAEPAEPQGDPE